MLKKIFLLMMVGFLIIPSFAERKLVVTLPDISQKAFVAQKIGLTSIKVVYHSPAVKKRVIWGKLVPYGKVWRAGANENTIIYFSTDVLIDGKKLSKGKYGLHMVPGKENWEIIFNSISTAWGSFFYKKEEDVLRVKVKPLKTSFREWLTYEFTDRSNNHAVLTMSWEKLSVPIKIEVNTKNIVVENMRKELRSLPFWYWRGTYMAAKYCLDNDINFKEALKWIEQSMNVEENFLNVRLKSKLLNKMGKVQESKTLEKYAFKIASDKNLTQYAYSLIGKDKAKCERILKNNIKKFKNWFTYRAIARYYNYVKKKDLALKYFSMALKRAPQHQKEKIKQTIKKLK